MNETIPPLTWIVPLAALLVLGEAIFFPHPAVRAGAALIVVIFAAYLFLAVVPQRTRGSGRR